MKQLFLMVLIMATWAVASAQECELRIKVRPTIATVSIDSQLQRVKGDGTVVVNLSKGEHEIVVAAEGFSSETRKINLQSATEEIRIYLELSPSSITVVSEDSLVGIYLNGELIGTGQCTKEVPPGEYEIEARMEGYLTQKQVFEIKTNESKELFFSALEPSKAKKKKKEKEKAKSVAVDHDSRIGFMLNYGYAMAPQQSFGATVFSVNETWGPYVNVMVGGNPFFRTDVACDLDGVVMINGESVKPKYTGDFTTSTLFAVGGAVLRIAKPLAVYAGLGYGQRKCCWQFDTELWAENEAFSYKGVGVDVGAMYFVGPVVFSLGAKTISFNYLELKAGIGISF